MSRVEASSHARGVAQVNADEQPQVQKNSHEDAKQALHQASREALRPRDETAAGTVAAYMHSNNISVVNLDQLKALSHDKNAPEAVQKAAATLVHDKAAWRAIETHDVKGADNISGVGNFDAAAQGLVKKEPPAPKPAPSGSLKPETEKQAGVLAAYMNSTGTKTVDLDKLYALANNTTGDVPKDVQTAARYMLQHPNEYKKIETHDVPGADGISGVGNFEAAAQGLIGKKAPPPPEPPMLGKKADKEAGVMAAYMNSKGMGAIDVNGLYALANDKSAPKEVREAAEFFLKHPKVFEAIETHDVAGADGISGVGNFEAAAQGQVTRAPRLAPAAPVDSVPSTPPTSDQVNKATDTVAKYFEQTGQVPQSAEQYQSMLTDLANNKAGNVPQEVQDAAKTILQSVGTPAPVTNDPALTPEQNAASQKIADFFSQVGYVPSSPEELHQVLQQMANDTSGTIPADVKAAAQTLLQAAPSGATTTPVETVSNDPALTPEQNAASQKIADFFAQAGFAPSSKEQLQEALQQIANDTTGTVPADVQAAAKTLLGGSTTPPPPETAQPQENQDTEIDGGASM